jgi:hypothetical protein
MKLTKENKHILQFVDIMNYLKKLIILAIAVVLSSCVKPEANKLLVLDPQTQPETAAEKSDVGTVNGGGGKGVACLKDGKQTVEVLDLYEAKNLYNLEINAAPEGEDQAEEYLVNLVARHYYENKTDNYSEYVELTKNSIRKFITNKIKFIESDNKLTNTSDSFEPLIGKDCSIVQIATFYDETALLIDRSLWVQLDWTNKMALLAHEYFYYQGRLKGASNSIMSRKFVGQLFSTKGVRPLSDGVPSDKTKVLQCFIRDSNRAKVGEALVFDTVDPKNGSNEIEMMEIVFTNLLAQPIMFRTSALITGVHLEHFRNDIQMGGRWSTELLVDSYDHSSKTIIGSYSFSADKKSISFKIHNDKTGGVTGLYEVNCKL